MHLKPKRLLPGVVLLAAATAFAVPPSWWTDGDPPVIDISAEPNNHGPANIGQAKHMAHSAISSLRQAAPSLADQVEEDLVGPGKPITSWDPPANEIEREKNHAPLLVGQLKAIATPFYEHIDAAAPSWLAAQRAANATESGGIFPWTDAPSDDIHQGMASIGQLKAVFALEFTQDTDGDGLADLAEIQLGTNPNFSDTDGDGVTDREEVTGGTDPNNSNTDGDQFENQPLLDGEDADPREAEINWRKAPECKYVWLEQVDEVDPVNHKHQPRAVNKRGQILFNDRRPGAFPIFAYLTDGTKSLWDSSKKEWITLPLKGSQEIDIVENESTYMSFTYLGETVTVPAGTHVFNMIEPVREFVDINDSGVIYGIAHGENYVTIDPLIPGMVWKPSTQNPAQYDAPSYFYPTYPFAGPGGSEIVRHGDENDPILGAIANDGTINSFAIHHPVGADWMTYDSDSFNAGNPATASMVSVRPGSENTNTSMSFPGAIIDANRALFVETLGLGAGATHCKVWLKEENAQTDISFMSPEQVYLAEMSLVPNKKDDDGDRLWITTGKKVYLEKRAGGEGSARWHNLTDGQSGPNAHNSMPEGLIRISERGEAITAGSPAKGTTPAVPPKLWRNGKYTDLNNPILTLKPSGVTISKAIDLASNGIILVQATESGVAKTGILLPVEVVEVPPLTKDEEGNDIAGSQVPSTGRPLTPFVELNPVADRIAHRELKVKIGEVLKGKTVTWTLDAVPDATPAAIRGRWNHSTSHPDRFETSVAYGANGFTRLSQESGRTTVTDDGFTAIRVNVPPVGFNQVRIRIQIEGIATPIDLIDMEVPGVVVIDPGHGGTANEPGSSWNNATSPSGALEKTMALNYGLALRDALRAVRDTDRLNLRIFMTRETDINRPGSFRAAKARDNGADVINIIHFNASDAHTARGTLEVYRTTSNVFPQQDTILSEGIITRMVTAMTPFDAGANHRARVVYESAVASDGNNGNTAAYCPVRTSYIEVEFIDFGAQTTDLGNDAVDILLNTGSNAGAVKTAIANAMRDGILHDLRNHQPQP